LDRGGDMLHPDHAKKREKKNEEGGKKKKKPNLG